MMETNAILYPEKRFGPIPGWWAILILLDSTWLTNIISFGQPIKENILIVLSNVQQSTHDVYNMCKKAKWGKRKQKATFLSLLKAQPIYEVHRGQWLIGYVQLNPF